MKLGNYHNNFLASKLFCMQLLLFSSTIAGNAQVTNHPDYAAFLALKLEPNSKVTYKEIDERKLQLHVFKPKGRDKHKALPAFIAFHGGGWAGGEPRRFYPIVSQMASHGLVGISVEYRLMKSGLPTTVFDCVKDARSAIRYIRKHANELGVDPSKIIVSGGSAGGHLAVATALFDEQNEASDDWSVSPKPNALVLYYPVIDTSPEGYGNKTIGEHWKMLSPLHQVKQGMPPTIVFHGTADTVCPFAGVLAFEQAMRKANNSCIVYSGNKGIHGYMMFEEDYFIESMNRTLNFLTSLGYIQHERNNWTSLFNEGLSNAFYKKGAWQQANGELTATEDQPIWSNEIYKNFELELEFKNDPGTNSGVFFYADTTQWVSHSVEIQIADDYDSVWAHKPKSWQCAAIFGHQRTSSSKVKPPGEWNELSIIAKGQSIVVKLNNEVVNRADLGKFKSATMNPDGSAVSSWLNFPLAQLPTRGHIGLQGKHAGKSIWFRNIRVRSLE